MYVDHTSQIETLEDSQAVLQHSELGIVTKKLTFISTRQQAAYGQQISINSVTA